VTDWTRSAIDRLGDRLRNEDPLQINTLSLLQEYFATLEPFADETFATIQHSVELIPGFDEDNPPSTTRRRLKTLTSIREKLRRQSTKLSQMQDIVGCRIVVASLETQNDVVRSLATQFEGALQILDRRKAPNNGYRAVHGIVREGTHRFEIQIRTDFQDNWASTVESLADRIGNEVKYGKGPPELHALLKRLSEASYNVELAVEEWVDASLANDTERTTTIDQQAREFVSIMRSALEQIRGDYDISS
jgi:ppGpp synthetase/RelA/SpoT-type nucleotidyltranferase